MVTITIKTDNAAFSDGNRYAEIARILHKLADNLARDLPRFSTKLYDVNGNHVGTVTLTGNDK